MTDSRSQQMNAHTKTPWMWAWRDDESAPASIFSMVREGHAYAVAMCPRYQKPDQWIADAKFILEAVNNHEALKARIQELESALDEIARQDDPDLSEQDLRQHDRHAGFSSGLRHCADMARAALSKGAA